MHDIFSLCTVTCFFGLTECVECFSAVVVSMNVLATSAPARCSFQNPPHPPFTRHMVHPYLVTEKKIKVNSQH